MTVGCGIRTIAKNEQWLKQCLDSIQGVFDEVVLVADGVKLPEWVKKYPIKYFETDKLGLCGARNIAALALNTDYIEILDDDDYLSPDAVSVIKDIRDGSYSEDIIHFSVATVSAEGFPTGAWGSANVDQGFLGGNIIPSGSIVKKSVFTKIGGFQVQRYEDWDFWGRAQKAGASFRYIPEVFYIYRQSPNSESQIDLLTHSELSNKVINHIREYEPKD